jgi:mono/diheme cytochrome c family protein
MKRWLAWSAGVAVVAAAFGLQACDNLFTQPKAKAWRPAPTEADRGNWPPLPPAGTIARDEAPVDPPALSVALLRRGQQRFGIYCAPCHSPVGDGQGVIVKRGFPAPPAFAIERLRQAPTQHFYDVITAGYGAMFSYADRVGLADRWAIAAYIRALQLSQHADLAALGPKLRDKLR